MEYIEKMNYLAKQNIPYIFIISYDQKQSMVIPISEIDNQNILYDINGNSNYSIDEEFENISLNIEKPVSYSDYCIAFDKLHQEFVNGNSFLANLTFRTPVSTSSDYKTIFYAARSTYKLYIQNQFVLFSPETFIRVNGNKIFTYPMKGTISALIPDAQKKLLDNQKEFAEHITVVDLLRNDLGIVSNRVDVTNFRYIVPVFNHSKPLLQTVSEIRGSLKPHFIDNPGDLMKELLPAGSICGAPKKKTLEIINNIENYNRGYYTGVFGIWQNGNIDSSVMIRFIDISEKQPYYKSGGGITVYSNPKEEYDELLQKIYIPQ